MLFGAKIRLYCAISNEDDTGKFEQFGHYRWPRDKTFDSWLRAFELMNYASVRVSDFYISHIVCAGINGIVEVEATRSILLVFAIQLRYGS
jgi:hypothetical protein